MRSFLCVVIVPKVWFVLFVPRRNRPVKMDYPVVIDMLHYCTVAMHTYIRGQMRVYCKMYV